MKGYDVMVKINGIPTKEEALALYESWKKERDDWNRNAKAHNRVLFLATASICVFLIIGVLLTISMLWNDGRSICNDPFGILCILALVMIPVIGAFIILLNWCCQWDYNEFSWPMKCKYYAITHDKTILKSKVENQAVYFTLENVDHEVTTAVLAICKEKYRTDVDEIVVDLEKEEILIPYRDSVCTE